MIKRVPSDCNVLFFKLKQKIHRRKARCSLLTNAAAIRETTCFFSDFRHPKFVSCSPPRLSVADRLCISIRDRQISLGTLMESQAARLYQGKPLFREPEI